MKNSSNFIIAILVQITILLILIVLRMFVLTGGTIVSLRLESDEYTYNMPGKSDAWQLKGLSELGIHRFESRPQVGSSVYIVLHKYGKTWEAGETTQTKPSLGNQIYIRGTVVSVESQATIEVLNGPISVVFGVEDDIDQAIRQDIQNYDLNMVNPRAKIDIDESGEATFVEIEWKDIYSY